MGGQKLGLIRRIRLVIWHASFMPNLCADFKR
jgi:hypothetical protein